MSVRDRIIIRTMTPQDYDGAFALWEQTRGFALRQLDDSREYVERFLERNPKTSVIAELDGEVVGSILCGHDGRQGCFYHVCVAEECRKHGIGKLMVRFALEALNEERISKVQLVAFNDNEAGNAFWQRIGWTPRTDLNAYEFIINEDNITRYVS